MADSGKIPQAILDAYEENKRNGVIPPKSAKLYYKQYQRYNDWKATKGIAVDVNSEATVSVYLEELAATTTPNSLFMILSMLKATLLAEHNYTLDTIALNKFLSKKGKDYLPKQAPILTKENLAQFMALPGEQFLIAKVHK